MSQSWKAQGCRGEVCSLDLCSKRLVVGVVWEEDSVEGEK